MQLLYHVCFAAMVPPAELSARISAAGAETGMRWHNNRFRLLYHTLRICQSLHKGFSTLFRTFLQCSSVPMLPLKNRGSCIILGEIGIF